MDQNKDAGFGALQQNDSQNPKAPGMKGYIVVNGTLYNASCWWAQSGKAGTKLDGVPHWQVKLELPMTSGQRDSGHVGGQPFYAPPRNAPVMPRANLGPDNSIEDDKIPF